MVSLRFVAATIDNQRRDGVIEAETVDQALAALRNRNLYVIRIDRPSRATSLWSLLNREIELRSPIGAADLAHLSQEWAGLLEAGITVDESLAIISQDSRPRTRSVLSKIQEDVKAGTPLHEALARFPNAFPPVFRALVHAGEKAGTLGLNLRRLGEDLMTRRGLAEDVRNALFYPAFLAVTATAGILVLLLVVVPNLENLIGEGGTEKLPAMTRSVLALSRLLREHSFMLVIFFAGLGLFLPIAVLLPAARARWDALVLKIAVVGTLVRVIETGRYMRTLGALLNGGVAVPTGLRIAYETVLNRRMRAGLSEAHQSVLRGAALSDAIAGTSLFGGDAVGLIRVGERTGRLAEALDRAAAMYEARSARRLKALTAMLAPVMTIGFGIVAGVIVYAMFSTILGINELAAP